MRTATMFTHTEGNVEVAIVIVDVAGGFAGRFQVAFLGIKFKNLNIPWRILSSQAVVGHGLALEDLKPFAGIHRSSLKIPIGFPADDVQRAHEAVSLKLSTAIDKKEPA